MFKLELSAIAASLLALSLGITAAQAQSRVFVAPQGSDANPCTFASPCRTFQHAHDVVAAGGEIDVLDPGGYGSINIIKAISIQGHGFSGIAVASSGTGITINAGAADAVSLNGLLIEGAGVGTTGISYSTGQSLTIANSVVRNLTSSGIAIAGNASSRIAISNTLVADNGGHGIYVQPSGANIIVDAVFNRVEAYNNGQMGIGIFSNVVSGASSRVYALIVDSVAGHNHASGFYGLGLVTFVSVYRSATIGNSAFGVMADGHAVISMSQSNVENDSWNWANGGCVTSYGDNYTLSVACETNNKH